MLFSTRCVTQWGAVRTRPLTDRATKPRKPNRRIALRIDQNPRNRRLGRGGGACSALSLSPEFKVHPGCSHPFVSFALTCPGARRNGVGTRYCGPPPSIVDKIKTRRKIAMFQGFPSVCEGFSANILPLGTSICKGRKVRRITGVNRRVWGRLCGD